MNSPNTATHENHERNNRIDGPSDRSFCYTFAVIGFVFAGISFWKGGNYWPWLAGGASIFGAVGLLAPHIFAPLNRVWFRIGMLLHKIMTPLIMGVVFFAVITPIALIMRLLGKQPLDLKYDPEAPSYWIERKPPGPEAESMSNQF